MFRWNEGLTFLEFLQQNNLPLSLYENADSRDKQAIEDIQANSRCFILKDSKKQSLSICVVPRSKSESTYKDNQKLFKSTVQSVAKELDKFEDASNYIVRTSNTKTTHLDDNTPNYNNDGKIPYIGITKETCNLDKDIKDKDILLIDDIYTAGVNIDEDAIQALMDKGAKSVTFYAVGACGI